jgi:uncharacterized phosphosugar-binding protein
MTVAGQWTRSAIEILERLAATQGEALERASELCADAIAADGLVHLFGTGHSRMAVEEMFPRYGSYPGFHPIVELSTTFHTQVVGANGQRQAMFIERVEGLAEVILSNFRLAPPDVMVVFSTSGVTANPIEMALGARARALPVIAVTSVDQSLASAPTHSSGTRLLDHADVLIDLGTPVGDALVDVDGLERGGGGHCQRDQGTDGAAAGRPRCHATGADECGGRGRIGIGSAVRRRLRRVRPKTRARPARRPHR